jgi:hypothetical protein
MLRRLQREGVGRKDNKGGTKTGFGPGFADMMLVADSRKTFNTGKDSSGNQMPSGPERIKKEERYGKTGRKNPNPACCTEWTRLYGMGQAKRRPIPPSGIHLEIRAFPEPPGPFTVSNW